jgi:hypothetical protein
MLKFITSEMCNQIRRLAEVDKNGKSQIVTIRVFRGSFRRMAETLIAAHTLKRLSPLICLLFQNCRKWECD